MSEIERCEHGMPLTLKCYECSEQCNQCREIREKYKGFGPRHEGSVRCESGSLASGGARSHCTCDTCFIMYEEAYLTRKWR